MENKRFQNATMHNAFSFFFLSLHVTRWYYINVVRMKPFVFTNSNGWKRILTSLLIEEGCVRICFICLKYFVEKEKKSWFYRSMEPSSTCNAVPIKRLHWKAWRERMTEIPKEHKVRKGWQKFQKNTVRCPFGFSVLSFAS